MTRKENTKRRERDRERERRRERLISFCDNSDANSSAMELQNGDESTKLTSRYVCQVLYD